MRSTNLRAACKDSPRFHRGESGIPEDDIGWRKSVRWRRHF